MLAQNDNVVYIYRRGGRHNCTFVHRKFLVLTEKNS